MKESCLDEKGFTLLETVIALAILSGVVVTLITVLNLHISAADRVQAITTATLLGREKIEEISIYGLPVQRQGEFSRGFEKFKWTVRDEDLERYGAKKIYLTVMWGKADKVDLITYRQK